MIRTRSLTAVVAAGMLAFGLAACSGPAGGSTAEAENAGTGSLDGGGAKVVVFMPTTSNVYLAADAEAIKAQAEELNYEVQIIENNFDQNEQDQQVQQFLATGEEVAAFLYWPASAEAGVNSTRLLAAQAPVIQFNQGVPEAAKEYVVAYAGVSDFGIGGTAGEMALQALGEADPATFNGPDGKPNMIEIPFPTGYQAGTDRSSSFVDAVGDAFNVLASEPVATVDAQGGFEAASQIIPRFASEGIDFIYAHSNNIAVGVVRALEQNGLVPGKDVIVVAGDYSGDKQPLRDGKIYSAVVQSPVIEGRLAMRTVAQYLATGEVQSGTLNIEPDEAEPELALEAPFETSIMPNPPITAANYDSFKIWGLTIEQLVV